MTFHLTITCICYDYYTIVIVIRHRVVCPPQYLEAIELVQVSSPGHVMSVYAAMLDMIMATRSWQEATIRVLWPKKRKRKPKTAKYLIFVRQIWQDTSLRSVCSVTDIASITCCFRCWQIERFWHWQIERRPCSSDTVMALPPLLFHRFASFEGFHGISLLYFFRRCGMAEYEWDITWGQRGIILLPWHKVCTAQTSIFRWRPAVVAVDLAVSVQFGMFNCSYPQFPSLFVGRKLIERHTVSALLIMTSKRWTTLDYFAKINNI